MQVTRFWNVYRSTWSTPILPFRSSGGQSTSEPLTSTAIQVQRGKNSPRAGEQLNATPAPRSSPSRLTDECPSMLRHYATESPGRSGNTSATESPGRSGNTSATESPGRSGNTSATESPGRSGNTSATESPGRSGNTSATEFSGRSGITNVGGVGLFPPAFANPRVITAPSKGKSNFFILLDLRAFPDLAHLKNVVIYLCNAAAGESNGHSPQNFKLI